LIFYRWEFGNWRINAAKMVEKKGEKMVEKTLDKIHDKLAVTG